MSEPAPSKFIYKLNAMENAGAQTNAFKAGYKEKRHAVLDHVAELERTLAEYEQGIRTGAVETQLLRDTLAAQRTALLALSERIRREGMQGVANSIEEIVK